MKEQVLDILKEGINDIEALKKQYPKMYTQDVIDALRRLQDRINELTIPDVSQQRELLIAFNIMLDYDIKRDSIEESVDYFLKNKWRYL